MAKNSNNNIVYKKKIVADGITDLKKCYNDLLVADSDLEKTMLSINNLKGFDLVHNACSNIDLNAPEKLMLECKSSFDELISQIDHNIDLVESYDSDGNVSKLRDILRGFTISVLPISKVLEDNTQVVVPPTQVLYGPAPVPPTQVVVPPTQVLYGPAPVPLLYGPPNPDTKPLTPVPLLYGPPNPDTKPLTPVPLLYGPPNPDTKPLTPVPLLYGPPNPDPIPISTPITYPTTLPIYPEKINIPDTNFEGDNSIISSGAVLGLGTASATGLGISYGIRKNLADNEYKSKDSDLDNDGENDKAKDSDDESII